jgi:hypothetical protein
MSYAQMQQTIRDATPRTSTEAPPSLHREQTHDDRQASPRRSPRAGATDPRELDWIILKAMEKDSFASDTRRRSACRWTSPVTCGDERSALGPAHGDVSRRQFRGNGTSSG